jgi:hypothetical protein
VQEPVLLRDIFYSDKAQIKMTEINLQAPKFKSILSIAGIIAILLVIDLLMRIYLNGVQIAEIKKNGKVTKHGI